MTVPHPLQLFSPVWFEPVDTRTQVDRMPGSGPVGNAATWVDGKPRPPAPCPRCGKTYAPPCTCPPGWKHQPGCVEVTG